MDNAKGSFSTGMDSESEDNEAASSFQKLVSLANAALASCNQDVPRARRMMCDSLTSSERDDVLWVGVCNVVAYATRKEGRALPIYNSDESQCLKMAPFSVSVPIDKRPMERMGVRNGEAISVTKRLLKRVALKAAIFHIGKRKLIDMRYEELREFCAMRESSIVTEGALLSCCQAVLAGMRPETTVSECWTVEEVGKLLFKYKVLREKRCESSSDGEKSRERSHKGNQDVAPELMAKTARRAGRDASNSERSRSAR